MVVNVLSFLRLLRFDTGQYGVVPHSLLLVGGTFPYNINSVTVSGLTPSRRPTEILYHVKLTATTVNKLQKPTKSQENIVRINWCLVHVYFFSRCYRSEDFRRHNKMSISYKFTITSTLILPYACLPFTLLNLNKTLFVHLTFLPSESLCLSPVPSGRTPTYLRRDNRNRHPVVRLPVLPKSTCRSSHVRTHGSRTDFSGATRMADVRE